MGTLVSNPVIWVSLGAFVMIIIIVVKKKNDNKKKHREYEQEVRWEEGNCEEQKRDIQKRIAEVTIKCTDNLKETEALSDVEYIAESEYKEIINGAINAFIAIGTLESFLEYREIEGEY